MSIRRTFKVLLYLVGVFFAAFGILGVIATILGAVGDNSRPGYFILFFEAIAIIVSMLFFFRRRYKAPCLRWSQYLWWILGATGGLPLALLLEFSFVPNPNDTHLPLAIFGLIFLLYGVALAYIAHLKPSLRQQVDESAQTILKTMPGKQISKAELIAGLQRDYKLPGQMLYQYIDGSKYIEQVDIPGTSIRVCRIKGTKIRLAFPQVHNITTYSLRQSVARTLPFLNEENVDIGLFLLSKEFEATLKAYLLTANAKGKLQIPVKDPPDKWKLAQMIDWVRNNDIITNPAVLNYLRQTRNDRAHGAMLSLAERHVHMMTVQYLAGLYIDYIKLFDDLSYRL